MSDLEVFGNLTTGVDVELAALATLELWMPTELARVERKYGYDPHDLPLPRSYTVRGTMDHWPEEQLPAVIVSSPGLAAERPEADGRGQYTAAWALGVGIVVSANDRPNSLKLSKVYAGAIVEAIMQHRSLGGFASYSEWETLLYTEIPGDEHRTLAGASAVFRVGVQGTVDRHGGLLVPAEDPYVEPEYDEFQTVETTIQQEG